MATFKADRVMNFDDFDDVKNYLNLLANKLEQTLNNIDEQNLNPKFLNEIKNGGES